MVRSLLLDRSRFCAEKLGDPVVDLNTTGPFAQAALPIGIKLDKIGCSFVPIRIHGPHDQHLATIRRLPGRTLIFWLPVPSMTKV